MQEVQLTVLRLLSVWWFIMWRGVVGGLIAGGIAGAIAGFVAAITGHSGSGAVVGSFAGLAVGPLWSLLVVRMALRKNYRGFGIALVSR